MSEASRKGPEGRRDGGEDKNGATENKEMVPASRRCGGGLMLGSKAGECGLQGHT